MHYIKNFYSVSNIKKMKLFICLSYLLKDKTVELFGKFFISYISHKKD